MQTARLKIRKFREDDLDNLFYLLSDVDVMKYLEVPFTKEATQTFLCHYGIVEEPLVYAVEDNNEEFVGYVIYHPYDEDSYEIGWVLHKKQWGKGYAAELTQCLIEDAQSKTDNLIIECLPIQIATKKIALKYGFSYVENRDGLDVYRLGVKSVAFTNRI